MKTINIVTGLAIFLTILYANSAAANEVAKRFALGFHGGFLSSGFYASYFFRPEEAIELRESRAVSNAEDWSWINYTANYVRGYGDYFYLKGGLQYTINKEVWPPYSDEEEIARFSAWSIGPRLGIGWQYRTSFGLGYGLEFIGVYKPLLSRFEYARSKLGRLNEDDLDQATSDMKVAHLSLLTLAIDFAL